MACLETHSNYVGTAVCNVLKSASVKTFKIPSILKLVVQLNSWSIFFNFGYRWLKCLNGKYFLAQSVKIASVWSDNFAQPYGWLTSRVSNYWLLSDKSYTELLRRKCNPVSWSWSRKYNGATNLRLSLSLFHSLWLSVMIMRSSFMIMTSSFLIMIFVVLCVNSKKNTGLQEKGVSCVSGGDSESAVTYIPCLCNSSKHEVDFCSQRLLNQTYWAVLVLSLCMGRLIIKYCWTVGVHYCTVPTSFLSWGYSVTGSVSQS